MANYLLTEEDIKSTCALVMVKIIIASMTGEKDSIKPDLLHEEVMKFLKDKIHA